MNTTNPYETLGISASSSAHEVKAAYIQLAKKHHPDKLPSGLSQQQKEFHEEEFKRISVAYHTIMNTNGDGNGWVGGAGGVGGVCEDWRTIWKNVFTEIRKHYHIIHVPVTLEEVHNRKRRKLELFLKDLTHPIYVRISCGDYPKTTVIQDGHIIKLKFTLENHPVYHLDDILGTKDLYTTCDIYWNEYLSGLSTKITWCDGVSDIPITIEPFPDLDVPIIIPQKGLWGAGTLYIKLRLVCPDKQKWSSLTREVKESVFSVLDATR